MATNDPIRAPDLFGLRLPADPMPSLAATPIAEMSEPRIGLRDPVVLGLHPPED
jgi:hypothetical protein